MNVNSFCGTLYYIREGIKDIPLYGTVCRCICGQPL